MSSKLLLSIILPTLLITASLRAAEIDVTFDEPALDRWNYPFNTSPGSKGEAKIFAPLTASGFDPMFDNRDGQMLLSYHTAEAVVPCQEPAAYDVTSVVITVQIGSNQTFIYDPTPDPWQSYLQPDDPDFVADADAGRPLEMFGVGWRNNWTAPTYPEAGPFCMGCNCFIGCCKGKRNAFPSDFPGGSARDVSNNVDDRFDPVPFAVGMTSNVTPGQLVPAEATFTFTLDVGDADVLAYVQAALDQDALALMITSLHASEMKAGGTFPEVYCKEDTLVVLGIVDPARLDLELDGPKPGDLDDDGFVRIEDLLDFLALWGDCPPTGPCAADFDCSGEVDISDLLILLSKWTL